MAFYENLPTLPVAFPGDLPHQPDTYTKALAAYDDANATARRLGPRLTEQQIVGRLRAADAADVEAIVAARRAGKNDPGPKNRDRVEREIRDEQREHDVALRLRDEYRTDVVAAIVDNVDRWLDAVAGDLDTETSDVDRLLGEVEQAAAVRDQLHAVFVWLAQNRTSPTDRTLRTSVRGGPPTVRPLTDLRTENTRLADHVHRYVADPGPAPEWPAHLATLDAYREWRPSKVNAGKQSEAQQRMEDEAMLAQFRRRYADEHDCVVTRDGKLAWNREKLTNRWTVSRHEPQPAGR